MSVSAESEKKFRSNPSLTLKPNVGTVHAGSPLLLWALLGDHHRGLRLCFDDYRDGLQARRGRGGVSCRVMKSESSRAGYGGVALFFFDFEQRGFFSGA